MSRLGALALAALLAACGGGVSSPGLNDDAPRVNDDPPAVNETPSPMDGDDEPSPEASPDEVSPPAPSDDPSPMDEPDAAVPDRDSEGELPVPDGSDGGGEPLGEIGEPCPLSCEDGDEPFCYPDALGCVSQTCSPEGVCVEPPPRDIALGEVCHDDAECASAYCSPRAGLFAPGTRLLTGWCEPRPAAAGWHSCTWRNGECVQ